MGAARYSFSNQWCDGLLVQIEHSIATFLFKCIFPPYFWQSLVDDVVVFKYCSFIVPTFSP